MWSSILRWFFYWFILSKIRSGSLNQWSIPILTITKFIVTSFLLIQWKPYSQILWPLFEHQKCTHSSYVSFKNQITKIIANVILGRNTAEFPCSLRENSMITQKNAVEDNWNVWSRGKKCFFFNSRFFILPSPCIFFAYPTRAFFVF